MVVSPVCGLSKTFLVKQPSNSSRSEKVLTTTNACGVDNVLVNVQACGGGAWPGQLVAGFSKQFPTVELKNGYFNSSVTTILDSS